MYKFFISCYIKLEIYESTILTHEYRKFTSIKTGYCSCFLKVWLKTQSCPVRQRVADRGCPLNVGVSNYNTENLSVDNSVMCLVRVALLKVGVLVGAFLPHFYVNVLCIFELVLVLNIYKIFAPGCYATNNQSINQQLSSSNLSYFMVSPEYIQNICSWTLRNQ